MDVVAIAQYVAAVGTVGGAVAAVIKYCNHVMRCLQLVLRAQLIEMIRMHLERGYCSEQDRAEVMALYVAYHSAGKNGVMDDRIEQFKKLPLAK